MGLESIFIKQLTKKLIVRFSNKKVMLPLVIRKKIDDYWNILLKSGKTYRRGEVFTVTKKEILDDYIEILVEKTDYAHYLYCQNVNAFEEYVVHIIHTAVLVETSDGKTIFGKMGNHTSRAGTYQLCGGGIDSGDLRGDVFDFDHNIKKELQEELGIDVQDTSRIKSFELAYFKEGGPTDKMTVIYKVVLNDTSVEFMKKYKKFTIQLKKGSKLPEFSEIVVIDNNKESFSRFFNRQDINLDEYMKPLFKYVGK